MTMFRMSTTTGMKNNQNDFGEEMRRARLERGLSLREASALVGISHTYLSALENGIDPKTKKEIVPSLDVIFKVCKAYDLDFLSVATGSFIPDEYCPVCYAELDFLKRKKAKKLNKELRNMGKKALAFSALAGVVGVVINFWLMISKNISAMNVGFLEMIIPVCIWGGLSVIALFFTLKSYGKTPKKYTVGSLVINIIQFVGIIVLFLLTNV